MNEPDIHRIVMQSNFLKLDEYQILLIDFLKLVMDNHLCVFAVYPLPYDGLLAIKHAHN